MYQATGKIKHNGKTRDVNIMITDLNDIFQASPDEEIFVYLVNNKNSDEECIRVAKSNITLHSITA